MDWAKYEALMSRVAEKVRQGIPELSSSAIRFGRTNYIEGASGYHHQIDVSVAAPAVALGLFGGHVEDAQGDRQLMHRHSPGFPHILRIFKYRHRSGPR